MGRCPGGSASVEGSSVSDESSNDFEQHLWLGSFWSMGGFIRNENTLFIIVYVPPMVTEVSATFVDKMSFLIPGGDGLKASNC